MCNPAMAVMAAMTAGSMYMNQQAQGDVVDQRNSVMMRESERQKELQDRANIINEQSQKRFTRDSQEEGIAEQAESREKFIQDSLPDIGTSGLSLMPGSDSATVSTDLGRRISDALSYGKDMASKQALLGAYGSNQFNNQIALGRSGLEVGQIGNTSARSGSLVGLELDAANQAGAGKRMTADLLRLGASAAGAYGMGAAPAATSAPSLGSGISANAGGIGFKPVGGLGLRFQ